TVLRSFTGIAGDGKFPYADLVEGNDGALYGTTAEGGDAGGGTIFKLYSPPVILTQPASRTAIAASTVTFSVVATGSDPPGYQWRKNGAILADGGNISGARTATLTLDRLTP